MYLKHFKYNMVPKLIGSEVVSITTTHRVKPLKYVHIYMNLNFMHILAIKNLMDLPYIYIYIGSNKANKACEFTHSKYACISLPKSREI